MAIGRIRTIWTGVAGSPLYTNLYFRNQATQTSADAVLAFWGAITNEVVTDYVATVESEAPIFDEVDGSLIAVEQVTGGQVGMTRTGNQLARATQGLLQFFTEGIVNNRRVRGRCYIPGPPSAVTTAQGNPSSVYTDAITAAYEDHLQDVLVRDTNAHVIWSRPVPADNPQGQDPRAGSAHTVTAWQTWSEWAVQRSRRD